MGAATETSFFQSIEIGESILHRTLSFFFSSLFGLQFSFFLCVCVCDMMDGGGWAHYTLVAHSDGRDWMGLWIMEDGLTGEDVATLSF